VRERRPRRGDENDTGGVVKRILIALVALTACAFLPATAGAVTTADRYIVVLDDGADAAAVADGLGLDATHVFSHALDGFSAQLSPATAATLEALREQLEKLPPPTGSLWPEPAPRAVAR